MGKENKKNIEENIEEIKDEMDDLEETGEISGDEQQEIDKMIEEADRETGDKSRKNGLNIKKNMSPLEFNLWKKYEEVLGETLKLDEFKFVFEYIGNYPMLLNLSEERNIERLRDQLREYRNSKLVKKKPKKR